MDSHSPLKDEASADCDHLFVLIHGLFGSPSDMAHMDHAIRCRFSHNVEVLCSDCNSGWAQTVDGIDAAGSRLANKIEKTMDEKPHLAKISFVAHNIGGLIARYAIGCLFKEGSLDLVRQRNLVTFSCPHLGASSASLLVADRLASHVLGKTGKQLMLADGEASGAMVSTFDVHGILLSRTESPSLTAVAGTNNKARVLPRPQKV
jgi:hypothetical protein